MTTTSATYTSKILPLGMLATISIALGIGMSLLFIGIFLGLPAYASTILLVGIMFLVISYMSVYATFSISPTMLSRQLNKKKPLSGNVWKEYQWSDVKAYKNGMDKGRYRGEFHYLEIKFKNGDEWTLTDMYGERYDTYKVFLDHFLTFVQTYNEQHKAPDQPAKTIMLSTPLAEKPLELKVVSQQQLPIERQKTFYETIWAKIFTISLGIFIVWIVIIGRPYMNITSIFKVIVVLIPGFIYMAYRSFIRKDP